MMKKGLDSLLVKIIHVVDEVLFPEVCIPVYSCPVNDNNSGGDHDYLIAEKFSLEYSQAANV